MDQTGEELSGPAVDCPQCGHVLRTADAWCPLCFTAAPSPLFTGPVATHRSDDPVRPAAVAYRSSRWAGSSVSFGPLGRVLVTLVLVGVTPVALWQLGAGGFVFVLLRTLVALPWALRDVWRGVRVRR